MRARNAALAAIVALWPLWAAASGEASGRSDLPPPPWLGAAPTLAGAPDLVAEAARWIGQGNPTGTRGAWCADFVSFVLARVGLPPLSGRAAASALGYGRRVAEPRPGDLVVLRTRRGAAGHVGFVESVGPDGRLTIVSGNWGRRVRRSTVPRRAATAFVRT